MDPITIVAMLLSTAIEIWRVHENHPPGWDPTAEDFARLRKNNARTLEDFERETQVRDLPPPPPPAAPPATVEVLIPPVPDGN